MAGFPDAASGKIPRARGALCGWRRLAGFLLIALAYFAFINPRPDYTPFNLEDSDGYLALSYGLVHGLGYTRSMIPGAYVPHTTWPPGLPLLLMPALALSGATVNWALVKATMVLTGVLGIALCWLYVRRIAASRFAADLAALLLALDPFYWNFSRIAMTEVPVVVWVLGSLLLIDRLWAGRPPRPATAALAGLLIGAGMLLKGTVIVLALAPLAYLMERRESSPGRRAAARAWFCYGAGFAVCFLAWMARNAFIDKTGLGVDGVNQVLMLVAQSPNDPASPLMTPAEVARNALYALREFVIYRVPEQLLPGLWPRDWLHWPGAVFLAASLTAALGLLAWPRRRVGWPLLITLVPLCLVNLVFVWGSTARMWVPVTALALPLLAINLQRWLAPLPAMLRGVAVAALLAGYGLSFAFYVAAHERHPYFDGRGELVALFERLRDQPLPPGDVWTLESTGYGLIIGRPAPLTVPGLRMEPRFTYMIGRTGDAENTALPPPAGAVPLMSEAPWTVYRLPRPMSEREILAPR